MDKSKQKPTGYDKFVNWKLFSIPLGLLLLMVFIPTPKSMLDVGVEYSMGPRYVQRFFAEKLFNGVPDDLAQWQMLTIRIMEKGVESSSFSMGPFLSRNVRWAEREGIPATEAHLQKARDFVKSTMTPAEFQALMIEGRELRTSTLSMDKLNERERAAAEKKAFQLKVAIGIVLFVVLCFFTEAIPLPIVAFCTGIIALLAGIVDRHSVAGMYWSDATWFIMGSLMFAAAFVKTGVDRRIAMMMFGKLKNPSLRVVTLVMIVIIAPLTMVMSDHALAAMFLPIGILLYTTASANKEGGDPELAKMLMITICMAANLGGSLAPSGAARNLIMMGYAEDMFGITIGFGQWMIYCVPFLLFFIPLTWIAINWRFKPQTTNLSEGLAIVKEDIARKGDKWTKEQIISVIIFVVTLFTWITESNLMVKIIGVRLGIGVFAVMGAIAYILAGVVNWRDYQTRVDWGVVWLYAGAIIFGRILVSTGAAYWIARTIVDATSLIGLGSGLGLLLSSNVITGIMTQLMADGPACAAVGPVTLAMAGIVHPGTTMIPFMAMATSIASSFAYCLVIGTPPNAIVYSSGYLTSKDFLRVGVMLWFTNMAVLLFMASTYWRILGWPGLESF
ncbi:MAG: DASS family sodium-coupled anion symporter [Desulfatibacillaceae bacterium]|nr:DASS family sodium-coupled anion symporter [Desulfatibacillaceae bacterium]